MNGGYVRDRSGQSTTTCGTPSPQNPKYRTKLCRNFPLGTCRYGEHCSYLHISTSSSPALSAQYPTFPNLSTVAQTIFQPCNNLLYNNAMFNEPASAPLRHVEEGRGASRLRRGDGSKRASRTPPQADHVEQWRLSVDTARDLSRLLPPAPPTTPISTAVSPAPSPSRPRVAQHEWRQSRADRPDRAQPSPPQRPETSRPGRPSASSIVRQQKRNQFFRTKPCRFFSEPAGCVKGDRCNFIHESPGEGSLPTGLTVPATEALSDCEGESATESSIQGELSPSTAATSEPPSCGSTQTEEPKKNFYPVTWRVVGGGVTLGGKREICESFMAGRCTEGADCRYAHPDTNDEDGLFGYPEPPMFAPFSPLSPMSPISPVLVPYPFVYPMVSPLQSFALPVIPGPLPMTPPPTMQPTPTPKVPPSAKNNLTVVTSVAQPIATSQSYSPHRVVDGATLLPTGSHRVDNVTAARAVVRPLSTPPTPVHGPDASIAKLFAAEMP